LAISARRAGVFLLLIAIGLTLAHIVSAVAWYRDLLPVDDWLYYSFFDLDEEESLGTWFSALILFVAGQLTLLQARFVRSNQRDWYGWWLILPIGFHLLSLDEVAGFHESVNTVVQSTHWTTYGLAIAVVVAAAYLPFLWSLSGRTRWLFILSGAIYLGGALGVEWGTLWYEDNDQLDTLAYIPDTPVWRLKKNS